MLWFNLVSGWRPGEGDARLRMRQHRHPGRRRGAWVSGGSALQAAVPEASRATPRDTPAIARAATMADGSLFHRFLPSVRTVRPAAPATPYRYTRVRSRWFSI